MQNSSGSDQSSENPSGRKHPAQSPTMIKRMIKKLASIRLAVVIILALGGVTAWGTIVESQYNAVVAQKLVYHSVWMLSLMLALAVSLIAVMIDRWPWQQKHIGFISAHIGILILMLGAVITQVWGIDGSVTMDLGGKGSYVSVGETEFSVYSTLDGERFKLEYDHAKKQGGDADFYLSPPSRYPFEIQVPDGVIKVVDYIPFAIPEKKIVPTDAAGDGAAVRFQLENANVNFTDWLMQGSRSRLETKNLGPAKLYLSPGDFKPAAAENAIVFEVPANLPAELPSPLTEELQKIKYSIYTARLPGQVKRGVAKAGDVIETGWMGMVLRVLNYLPRGNEETKYRKLDRPTELTVSAVKVVFENRNTGAKPVEYWIGMNSVVKIFTESAAYFVRYSNKRVPLGFELTLQKFNVGRYPGTMRAASYESVVKVPDLGDVKISMNEPLKHNGFTFYQASFQEDERGQPTASVLSVNRDPGRGLKYFGSLLIVLGIVHLFYFKKKAARVVKPAA